MVLRALHLCSGYGGFELALRLAGIDARTVAHVERDSHAAATLVARMGEKALDQAPVWDDVTTFDGRPWRGRVDLITAGFNCQPFSSAGQRRGVDDERWLWPDIARIVADVGPRYVFLENVPGLVRLGLPHILADLADLGFDAEWGLLSAAAVGAPHRRERFWLLAFPHDAKRRGRECAQQPGRTYASRTGAADVAQSQSVDGLHRRRLGEQQSERRWGRAGQHSEGVEPCSGGSDDADVGAITPGQADTWRTARGAWPPPPDDHDGWDRWRAQGGPEPSIRRSTDGRPLGLADALHSGGNGLVPRVAAVALHQLAERAGVELMWPPKISNQTNRKATS